VDNNNSNQAHIKVTKSAKTLEQIQSESHEMDMVERKHNMELANRMSNRGDALLAIFSGLAEHSAKFLDIYAVQFKYGTKETIQAAAFGLLEEAARAKGDPKDLEEVANKILSILGK
jgi:hypothetical protein